MLRLRRWITLLFIYCTFVYHDFHNLYFSLNLSVLLRSVTLRLSMKRRLLREGKLRTERDINSLFVVFHFFSSLIYPYYSHLLPFHLSLFVPTLPLLVRIVSVAWLLHVGESRSIKMLIGVVIYYSLIYRFWTVEYLSFVLIFLIKEWVSDEFWVYLHRMSDDIFIERHAEGSLRIGLAQIQSEETHCRNATHLTRRIRYQSCRIQDCPCKLSRDMDNMLVD